MLKEIHLKKRYFQLRKNMLSDNSPTYISHLVFVKYVSRERYCSRRLFAEWSKANKEIMDKLKNLPTDF